MSHEMSVMRNNTERAASSPERVLFQPRIDVVESADVLTVYAEMPGADDKSVDVSIERDTLTVRAKVEPPVAAEGTRIYSEYAVGDYERRFTLSNDIDRSGIAAHLHNGVLKLVLPKIKQAQARKIEVRAG